MKYRIETHSHTITSRCGRLASAELVSLYKNAGYGAVVITDHFYRDYFEPIENKIWSEKIEIYLKEYYSAVNESIKIGGINVILGIELRFNESSNDYLIYGIDEDFLVNNPEIYTYSIENFKKTFSLNNPDMVIIQAHPFRSHITLKETDLLDGYEIINLCPRHDNGNEKAEDLKIHKNLIFTSGSDCHRDYDVGLGGILSDTLPKDSFEFASLLKSGNYELICDE